MDHFKLGTFWYLVVSDYFSRFLDVIQVGSDMSSKRTVNILKHLFCYLGVPEVLRCDNAPNFISQEMKNFSEEFNFKIITSSPHFPQSNGFAEAMVKIAKKIIEKGDLDLGLLAYRSTPLESGYSPAELLFGRKLRTKVPTPKEQLIPKWPDFKCYKENQQRVKEKQRKNFNEKHRAKELQELDVGTEVWVVNLKQYGTVVQRLEEPRSYMVNVNGTLYRRNRIHLIPTGDSYVTQHNGNETTWLFYSIGNSNAESKVNEELKGDEHNARKELSNQVVEEGEDINQGNVMHTRSGRAVHRPSRYMF